MKTTWLTIALLLVLNTGFSQKMITRSGEIKFEATMPGIEEIAGTNTTVSCILDKSNGEIAALALVKAFRFKSPLMEEHFNENYMDSDTFPKATFKGKILNFDASKLGSGKPVAYELAGDLTIHGITKKIKTKINISGIGDNMIANSSFQIKITDYGIEIPSLVKTKIAENAKVSLNFNLATK